MAAAFGEGGFDYTFDPPLSDDYICSICLLALRDPVITTCGHLFCNSCLEEAFRRFGRVCPVDKNELDARDPFPNKHVERIILNSYVRCPNTGCALKIIVSDVENHRTECPYEEIPCTLTDCTVRVLRDKLHDHVSSECQWRNYECIYCKENLLICKKEVHEQTCRRFPVKCTNGCNDHQTLPREELPTHLEKECPLTEVNCDYKGIGCSNKVVRQQLDDHLKRSTNIHLELACKKVFEMAETVNKLVNTFENQTEELEALKKQNKVQQAKLLENQRNQTLELEALKKQNQAQQAKLLENQRNQTHELEALKVQNQVQQAQLLRNLDIQKQELKISVKMLEVQQTGLLLAWCEREREIARNANPNLYPRSSQPINTVRTSPLRYVGNQLDVLNNLFQEQLQTLQRNQQAASPFIKVNSVFVWRLPFSWTIYSFLKVCEETRKREREFFSNPFYSGPLGYRLRIFIKPLGTTMECQKSVDRSKHTVTAEKFQVGIVVVDGEYDSFLPWPFYRDLKVNLGSSAHIRPSTITLRTGGEKEGEKTVSHPCISECITSSQDYLTIRIERINK